MASRLDIQSRMLYPLLASCLMSHLNNAPKPDSVQEPGFKIFRGCLLVRQPRLGGDCWTRTSDLLRVKIR